MTLLRRQGSDSPLSLPVPKPPRASPSCGQGHRRSKRWERFRRRWDRRGTQNLGDASSTRRAQWKEGDELRIPGGNIGDLCSVGGESGFHRPDDPQEVSKLRMPMGALGERCAIASRDAHNVADAGPDSLADRSHRNVGCHLTPRAKCAAQSVYNPTLATTASASAIVRREAATKRTRAGQVDRRSNLARRSPSESCCLEHLSV